MRIMKSSRNRGKAVFFSISVPQTSQTVPASGVRVVPRHAVPEIRCGAQIVGVPGQLVAAGQTHQLGDLRVGMQSGELILARGKWSEDAAIVEPA